jgi:glycosyltransferase involved in cell wall biosynthesis
MGLPYVLSVNSLQQRWRHFAYQNQIHPLSISSGQCAKIIVPAKSIADNVVKLFPKFIGRIEQINTGTFAGETSRCFSKPSRMPGIVIAHPSYKLDDVENLFGAIRHLSINGYEFVTVVIGDSRAEKQMRRLLAALGLLQTVTIVPRLKPWRSIVSAGDIFIQPAVGTAFNPLLLEAMSVGQAVLACKGGVDDMIIDNKTAIVFDPSDEHSIISSLLRFLDRREFARQIAGGAQQYVRENHKVSNMISSTLRTYQEAVLWYKH